MPPTLLTSASATWISSYCDGLTRGLRYKRQVILKTEKPFPDLALRSKVVSRSEKVFTPIENAIGIIEEKAAVLLSLVLQRTDFVRLGRCCTESRPRTPRRSRPCNLV